MIRKISFLLFCLLLTATVRAGEVNEAEALQQAKAFMAGRGIQLSGQAKLRLGLRRLKAGRQDAASYYVFNVADEGGYVIVSGDDRTVSILGYADSGSVSEDDMPDALRYLLDGYARQMEWLDGQADVAAEAKPRKVSATRTAISPFISTKWNQGAPYNNLCPTIGDTKTVTGCVATSMAQVMYYYKWPEEACTAIPGYVLNTWDADKTAYSTTLDGLSATTFSWNAMTKTYATNATGDAADAVAKLMQYCGWSLQMVYGLAANGGSSAFNECVVEALKLNFGYDSGTRHALRRHYSYQEWVNLIYSELSDGHPVVLGGQASGGGHSFVCDGYDAGDYFHINWGWGGSSDGYYRLSALNPYEQGIGGSSSLDGFSYSQDAVIGIQPPTTGNTQGYCLSLEGFRFGASDSDASKTFSRAASTDDFADISLYVTLCCYRFGGGTFDYAVQLIDESGQVAHTLCTANSQSMEFNKNLNASLTGLSIPSTVADGTYYIKVVSKTSDTYDWQECYDGNCYQMTATISGNTLTIDAPIPAASLPTLATLVLSKASNKTVGYEQEVIVSLTGGTADYHGDLLLRVGGTSVVGKQVDIPAGQTVDVHFFYTPTAAGDNVLTLWNTKSGGTQIGTSTTVVIATSDAANTQTLGISYTFDNLNEGKLYGNAVRLSATVTNPSADNSYSGKLYCSLRKYESAEAEDGDFVSTLLTKNITIEKGSAAVIAFEYDGLEPGKYYCARFSYQQGYEEDGKLKTRTVALDPSSRYVMGEGYALYAADATTTIYPVAATIDAGTAVCADLRAISSFDGVEITTSTNPNCLYLLAENADVPAALDDCNVVKGSAAEALTLTDGYDFYTPVSFTASTAAYTRTFSLAANGADGWNTIMLPFTVATVTCGGAEVDWFHSSSDTGKNFWLKAFSGDEAGSVYFDFAETLQANTPYIIAVPDDRWGSEWQMTGKPVTFSGTNATIAATETFSVSGDNYKFLGDTRSTSVSKLYALNAAGGSFKYSESATTIDAFRAWFVGSSISSLAMPALGIANGPFTGISAITTDEANASDDTIYDFSGRKVTGQLRPGIYIVGGKKKLILK